MNSIDYEIKAMKMLIDEMKETIENQKERIKQLEKERNMYKGSFEEMSKNYFELENIRKETLEYIGERFDYDEETGEYYLTHTFDGNNVFDLLNILNKGSDKQI